MRTLMTHATLIDGVQPASRPESWVLIGDGRIEATGPMAARPEAPDAAVLDLGGACVMPGLWDVHVHPDFLSLAEVPLPETDATYRTALARTIARSRERAAAIEPPGSTNLVVVG